MTRYLIEVWKESENHKCLLHLFDHKVDTMTKALEIMEANEKIEGRRCKLYSMTEVKFSEEE